MDSGLRDRTVVWTVTSEHDGIWDWLREGADTGVHINIVGAGQVTA